MIGAKLLRGKRSTLMSPDNCAMFRAMDITWGRGFVSLMIS